ncbi:MAG: hypothetical protein C0467_14710 [Planctomycetaceae bacterium]|nr:hypothetical protein [Planctomycetaceae bacterium]
MKPATLAAPITILLVFLVSPTPVFGAADPASDEFFETRVRPVLVRQCFSCHSGEKRKGGLSVESREALLAGGDSGTAIVAGKPDESRLITAVRYKDVDFQMPPKGKLAESEIADLTAWVKAGAAWPKGGAKAAAVRGGEISIAKRKQEHWAWQSVRPAAPPAVRDRAWVSDAADAFILAGLETRGLKPASPADAATWLRRVTFDLTGLPPSPEDVERFLADSGPAARAAVVDRLLASPAFGVRWGRHWLDLVRYAESRGHEFDFNIPNAYQYRDYVVRAINADVPYDRFIREQIAGDLITPLRTDPATGANESVLGTGFWFLGEEIHSPVDVRQDQADRFDNRIDVFSKATIGLTVSCARCHDHKFDAITQKDYTALYGFLSSSSYRQVRFDAPGRNEEIAAELAARRAKAAPVVGRILADAATDRRVADYLLAARAVILASPADEPIRLIAMAKERGLEAPVLTAWVRAIRDAVRNPTDPLHLWGEVCDPALKTPQQFAAAVQSIKPSDRMGAASGVVFDLGKLNSGDWMPDGPAFGARPRQRGEFSLGGTPERPIVEYSERAAATYDRTWDVLRGTTGTQLEPGALGRITERSGRTLRTPSFKLNGGVLYYLIRGKGTVYAPVASHVMIAGPLHGKLVTEIKASAPGFHWHRHDLSGYRGLTTHLEFTPAVGSDFAVAAVVQSDRPPANYPEVFVPSEAGETPDKLAAAYAKAFDDATHRLREDTLTADDAPSTAARIAAWLASHPEVLADQGRAVVKTAAEFVAEQQKLITRIRAESRLAPAILDGSGVDEPLFIRGQAKAEGEIVPRRFLEALDGKLPAPARGSGRLELASAVTNPERNPLVARVAVNRVWHHLFGRGIVASVDNFSVLGERPTHPELLDHLADRFVRDGWSTKRLIRALVLSNTYAMSSRPSVEGDRLDPGNLTLHRARLRRLDAEAVRDAVLAVSGRLDQTLGGPSVPTYLSEFVEGKARPASGPLDGNGRRTLYLSVRRNFLSPMLLAFDMPVPFSTVGKRSVSNVASQSLMMMNDPFIHQQAEVWGKRIAVRPGTTAERVRRMYLEAFARAPTDAEAKACRDYLAQQTAPGQEPGAAAWAALAHVLFNMKEFIFLG